MPLSDQLLQAGLNERLELRDRLGAECMRDGLPFTSMLGSVTGVEEATADGYEGIIVIAARSCGSVAEFEGSEVDLEAYLFVQPPVCE